MAQTQGKEIPNLIMKTGFSRKESLAVVSVLLLGAEVAPWHRKAGGW